MTINIRDFALHSVIDTCAIWHVLASRILYAASKTAKCKFCCTDFVLYECLYKVRQKSKSNDKKLQEYLKQERDKGFFKSYSISLEDLQSIEILEKRKSLGKGELSSIIFSKKTRQAFMSDDKKARKLAAEEIDAEMVQSTVHLFGWLFYTGLLTDADKDKIIEEHVELGGISKKRFINQYTNACKTRLVDRCLGD